MANFKRTSRYANGMAITNREGQKFLILRKTLNLEENAGDVFITVTQDLEKRPDLVSFKAYGNFELWWVIYEFNGIRDPFFDLRMGMILRIPALERVLTAINELEA